jgi:hypothetical protein
MIRSSHQFKHNSLALAIGQDAAIVHASGIGSAYAIVGRCEHSRAVRYPQLRAQSLRDVGSRRHSRTSRGCAVGAEQKRAVARL